MAGPQGTNIIQIIQSFETNADLSTSVRRLTMPSGEAQATLIRHTYARAGLDLAVKSDRPQYFEVSDPKSSH